MYPIMGLRGRIDVGHPVLEKQRTPSQRMLWMLTCTQIVCIWHGTFESKAHELQMGSYVSDSGMLHDKLGSEHRWPDDESKVLERVET